MKRITWILGLAAAVGAAPVFGLDLDPVSRQKAVAAAGAALAPAAPAVEAALAHRPLPDLPNGLDANGRSLSGTCNVETSDLCYDYKERRLVYRPSRNWMPEFNGLRAEHISVRRDTVVFKYSFK